MKNGIYDIFVDRWGNDIYIYSDTHFGDLDSYKIRFPEVFDIESINRQLAHSRRVLAKDCNIDYTGIVKQLDQMQIDNINRKCGKASTLIILGDVGDIQCVKKLKAKYKILILGNHDKGASNYKRIDNGATVLLDNKKIVCPHCGSNDVDVTVCPSESYFSIKCHTCKELYEDTNIKRITLHREDNHLFDEVYEGTLQIGPKIILSHEPFDYKYCLNIHGHTHNITEPFYTKNIKVYEEQLDTENNIINKDTVDEYMTYHYCVIGEANNYEPVSLSRIIKSGCLSEVPHIHRETIDRATEMKNLKANNN